MNIFSRVFSFFHRLFDRKPAPKDTVTVDDDGVVHTMLDGRQETMQWADLQSVSIVTTSDGPLGDDLYWMLVGTDHSCLVPGSAEGADELLTRLQQLPDFNSMIVVLAMGSTQDQRFLCWQRAEHPPNHTEDETG